MNCPKCGNSTAHRTHRTWLDYAVTWLGFLPYKCKDCQRRFLVWRNGELSPRLRTTEERRIMQLRRSIRWRRTRGELLLYGLGSLIFLAVLFYLLTQHISTE